MTEMNDTTKQLVMDIAMNLNRIGNWIADGYQKNFKKINIFLKNNDEYISRVNVTNKAFQPTWDFFLEKYVGMKSDLSDSAEDFMTFGNILTHRSKLIN